MTANGEVVSSWGMQCSKNDWGDGGTILWL